MQERWRPGAGGRRPWSGPCASPRRPRARGPTVEPSRPTRRSGSRRPPRPRCERTCARSSRSSRIRTQIRGTTSRASGSRAPSPRSRDACESASRDAFMVEVMRLLALLGPGDGHTNVFPLEQDVHLLPPPVSLRRRRVLRPRRGAEPRTRRVGGDGHRRMAGQRSVRCRRPARSRGQQDDRPRACFAVPGRHERPPRAGNYRRSDGSRGAPNRHRRRRSLGRRGLPRRVRPV
jgi:hypothetical protein